MLGTRCYCQAAIIKSLTADELFFFLLKTMSRTSENIETLTTQRLALIYRGDFI